MGTTWTPPTMVGCPDWRENVLSRSSCSRRPSSSQARRASSFEMASSLRISASCFCVFDTPRSWSTASRIASARSCLSLAISFSSVAFTSRARSSSDRVSKNHLWNFRSELALSRWSSTTAWNRFAPAAERSVTCLASCWLSGSRLMSSLFCSNLRIQ